MAKGPPATYLGWHSYYTPLAVIERPRWNLAPPLPISIPPRQPIMGSRPPNQTREPFQARLDRDSRQVPSKSQQTKAQNETRRNSTSKNLASSSHSGPSRLQEEIKDMDLASGPNLEDYTEFPPLSSSKSNNFDGTRIPFLNKEETKFGNNLDVGGSPGIFSDFISENERYKKQNYIETTKTILPDVFLKNKGDVDSVNSSQNEAIGRLTKNGGSPVIQKK